MTRRRCPACGSAGALFVREGVGGVLVLCREGCARAAILDRLPGAQLCLPESAGAGRDEEATP